MKDEKNLMRSEIEHETVSSRAIGGTLGSDYMLDEE
jgi:hypothetical protein